MPETRRPALPSEEAVGYAVLNLRTTARQPWARGTDAERYALDVADALPRMRADAARLPELEARVRELEAGARDMVRPRPADEWHEDDGSVIWWSEEEPSEVWVGTPLDSDWPDDGLLSHWTPLPNPAFPNPAALSPTDDGGPDDATG